MEECSGWPPGQGGPAVGLASPKKTSNDLGSGFLQILILRYVARQHKGSSLKFESGQPAGPVRACESVSEFVSEFVDDLLMIFILVAVSKGE